MMVTEIYTFVNKRSSIVYLMMCSILFIGCNKKSKYSEQIIFAFNSAGKNKIELLKALNYYCLPKDSLKRKAMFYLVENLSDQFHYEGLGVNSYRKAFHHFDSLNSLKQIEFRRLWVKMQDTLKVPSLMSVTKVRDVQVIKADFLIRNVESAFVSWSYPWAQAMSFDDFCEYILPYKIQNEDLEDWRSPLQKKYHWIVDSLKGNPDPRKACLLINRDLKQWFHISPFSAHWDLTMNDLLTLKGGRCQEATAITLYAMRAMGLPIVIDYTPYWANKNSAHEWNALLYNGKTLHFVGSESDPGMDKIQFTMWEQIRRKRAKVFRKTYRIQKSIINKDFEKGSLPLIVYNRRIIDVTNAYVPVSNIKLKLSKVPSKVNYCFLSTFNQSGWNPICTGYISIFNNSEFDNIGRDIVYLPIIMKDFETIPVQSPFILDKAGIVIFLKADSLNPRRICLRRKYPEDNSNRIIKNEKYELFFWNNKWSSLGEKTATSDSLTYLNAPSNALFLLKRKDKGKQERIFTYDNNIQTWW